jgi:hypothetical protein
MEPNTTAKPLMLPTCVVAPADMLRLVRELTVLDEFLRQAALRKGGSAVKLPATSRNLDAIITVYEVNLLQASDRTKLLRVLDHIRLTSPQIHISLAADPSAAFTDKITSWLRQNVHPQLLVKIGLEPSIGAGCIVRTTNKQFDFSLRQRFVDSRKLLIQKIQETVAE